MRGERATRRRGRDAVALRTMRILASFAAVSLVIASFALLASYGALAQASAWTQMSPATAPSPRLGHAMAYDSESDRVLLFGGETAPLSNVLNDETWVYDLNTDTWENRNPSPRPSARVQHAMAYDADSDRIILFGGWTGTGQSTETWAYDFDSNTWTRRNPSESPLPRGGHFMAYDAASDRIVLFGGGDGTTDLGDTWAYDYDGDRWIRMNPGTSPSPRHGAAMAYDADADRAVLYGGIDGGDETWVYDVNGDAWTLADEGSGPSSRFGARVSYDTESGRIVLFGGSSGGDETWSHRFVSPPPSFPWPIVAAVGVAVAAAVAAILLVRRRRRKVGE